MTELEKKIIAEFIHGNGTVRDYIERREFATEVQKIPEYRPENVVAEISIMSDRRAVIEYDNAVAEISAEKDARYWKYMRNHYVRNDGQPIRKDKRKAYVKERHYSCDAYIGWDTVRKFRQIEAEKADARDWQLEQAEIAYAKEQELIMAEIRRWEEEAKAEQERCRRERQQIEESRKLREWLKWA